MARNIWITSDTHYNHTAIISFIDYNNQRVRDFDNVDIMNECLLDSWNSVVKPGDIVYHLGDVFFGDTEKFEKDWPKFNGRKTLILGNHDDGKYLASGAFFRKVGMWRMFPEYGILLSHVPLHQQSLYRGKDLTAPMMNVHGHIHRLDSPSGSYFNACVEKTNYTPVHIEVLAEIAKMKRIEFLEQKEKET